MSSKRTDTAITDRRAATLVGVLYIVGTAAGVLAAVIMPSAAAGNVLADISAHRAESIVGALLILTMGFALSALAAVFYPVGRRYSEALSMGYVIFRGALEGMIYILTALLWLVLVAMSAQPVAAAPVASVVQTTLRVIPEQLGALPFVIGAFMLYPLLYRARLVPRWLSVWGLVGAGLYLMAPIARMAGLSLDFLMAPLALQEMVLAVWLIARGFSSAAVPLSDPEKDARALEGPGGHSAEDRVAPGWGLS
jgi:hypothetical protein